MEFREVATGLKFPEGPVAMDDGSIILVEIAAGKITRVKQDGKTQTIAKPGGGPNGLAIGPDAALYVCNNGSNFTYVKRQGLTIPGHAPESHTGGQIERVEYLHRQSRNALQRMRRQAPHGAERPRVRHGRRFLVHRSRHDHA